MTTVECVVDAKDKLGEGAFWCPVERALYWLDVPMPSMLQRFDPATARLDRWPMPEMIMSMAKRRDGTLLVASHHGLNVFDPATGALKRIAAPEADKPANRSNDGAPDGKGRFWFGSMANNIAEDGTYFSPGVSTGTLWKIEPDLRMIPVEGGIGISNATAWSPDWSTFYFADTAEGAIFAWDFDLELGALSNKRVFAAPEGLGYPDGACIDAEGYLWNARWEGSCVVRFAPDGSVDRVVRIPAERVTSCAFGGADLGTLYVTTSRLHLTDEQLANQPLAGGVFAFRPGVHGLPRPAFAG